MADTNISDDAVREATGHDWAEWFDRLDAFGAADAGHKASAAWLHEEHGVAGWWAQMITVQYERDRGLREVGEAAGGFQMGAQRTFLPDQRAAWSLLVSPEGLATWLGASAPDELVAGEPYELSDGTTGEIRVVEPGSHVRLTWQPPDWDEPSTLQVRANEASSGRGTIAFHHEGLPDQQARQAMKDHWRGRLSALREVWMNRETG